MPHPSQTARQIVANPETARQSQRADLTVFSHLDSVVSSTGLLVVVRAFVVAVAAGKGAELVVFRTAAAAEALEKPPNRCPDR